MSLFPDMTTGIRFFVEHEPIPQPRQRHAIRNGIMMNYIPKSHPVHVYKQAVQLYAKMAYQGQPLESPLKAYFLFLLPRPARLVWKTRAMPRAWSPGRPDIDNYLKAIFDALNGLVFKDDSQIVRLEAIKQYCAGDESPGVDVLIEELA